MDDTAQRRDNDQPYDSSAAWAAACVSALLSQHGVSARQQAAVIAQICAISVSQARRKLRGAVWLFDEVMALCRHYGASLDAVFAPDVQVAGGPAVRALSSGLPATLWVDGLSLPCQVLLGPRCNGQSGGCDLVATLDNEGWVAGAATTLDRAGLQGPRFRVDHLQLASEEESARPRIAVLDDDPQAAQSLSDWFNEVGFDATPYTEPRTMFEAQPPLHQAYVVDLILADGQTSQAVVERIRQRQPEAPVVLLTGQLRDGVASESTLATLLRTQNVTFFEKPVRPAVITAALQSSLDRLQASA